MLLDSAADCAAPCAAVSRQIGFRPHRNLAGNLSLIKMVEESDFLAISVISKLEFLSYPDLTEDEKNAFFELLEDLTVFDLTASDDALMQEAVAMRIDGGLKLPDAVIAATALVNHCEVITNDAHFAHQKRVQARTYDL